MTLTQSILAEVQIAEGDKVLVEALPPRRIILTKEEQTMPNTRRVELELELLESRKTALQSELDFAMSQYKLNMPCEPGIDDPSIFELRIRQLEHDKDQIAVEIAQKRLELFELQGT